MLEVGGKVPFLILAHMSDLYMDQDISLQSWIYYEHMKVQKMITKMENFEKSAAWMS